MYTKRLSADKQKNQRASWAQRVLVYPQMIASTDTLDAARRQVVYRDIMNSECTCFTDYKSITWNSAIRILNIINSMATECYMREARMRQPHQV